MQTQSRSPGMQDVTAQKRLTSTSIDRRGEVGTPQKTEEGTHGGYASQEEGRERCGKERFQADQGVEKKDFKAERVQKKIT